MPTPLASGGADDLAQAIIAAFKMCDKKHTVPCACADQDMRSFITYRAVSAIKGYRDRTNTAGRICGNFPYNGHHAVTCAEARGEQARPHGWLRDGREGGEGIYHKGTKNLYLLVSLCLCDIRSPQVVRLGSVYTTKAQRH